jgi:hypothetical protein
MTPSVIGRWGWNFPKIEPGPWLETVNPVWRLDKPRAWVGDKER